MEVMFSRLFIICAAAIICELICENTSSGEAVKTVCSLCICITVFTCFLPKGNIFEDFYNSFGDMMKETEAVLVENRSTELIDKTQIQLEKNISKYISENFGINPDTVRIQFSTTSDNDSISVSVESAEIAVKEDCSTETQTAIKAAISAFLGCEVFVR